MLIKRFVVKKNERGALFRDGDFERMLAAGPHYFIDPLRRLSVVTWQRDTPMADLALIDDLLAEAPETAAGRISPATRSACA